MIIQVDDVKVKAQSLADRGEKYESSNETQRVRCLHVKGQRENSKSHVF